uniref:hypothetical protein n=1 Tax=Nocardia wallacei TaxID=480035 RepID=UPI002454EF09
APDELRFAVGLRHGRDGRAVRAASATVTVVLRTDLRGGPPAGWRDPRSGPEVVPYRIPQRRELRPPLPRLHQVQVVTRRESHHLRTIADGVYADYEDLLAGRVAPPGHPQPIAFGVMHVGGHGALTTMRPGL